MKRKPTVRPIVIDPEPLEKPLATLTVHWGKMDKKARDALLWWLNKEMMFLRAKPDEIAKVYRARLYP